MSCGGLIRSRRQMYDGILSRLKILSYVLNVHFNVNFIYSRYLAARTEQSELNISTAPSEHWTIQFHVRDSVFLFTIREQREVNKPWSFYRGGAQNVMRVHTPYCRDQRRRREREESRGH